MKKFLSLVAILGIISLPLFCARMVSAQTVYYPTTATISGTSTVTFNNNQIDVEMVTCGYSALTGSANLWQDTITAVATSSAIDVHNVLAVPDTAPTYWISESPPQSSCLSTYPSMLATGLVGQVFHGSYSYPFYQNNTSGVIAYFGTKLSELKTMMYTNIPLVLEIGMALIGLGIAIHYVRKWVGRRA